GRAVVNFIVCGDTACDCGGGDVGGSIGRGIERVIAGIGATQGDAADRDGLGRANVLVGKTGAGVAGGQAVTAQPVVGKSDRGAGGAVVDLVGAGGGYVQRASSDVGGGAGSRIGRIVGRIGAGNRDACDADALGGADVLVRKAGACVAGA